MKKEEELLLQRCFLGERTAWENFVNMFIIPISRTVKCVLDKYDTNCPDSTLEDLTQGIFLSLMEDDHMRLRQFRGERHCSLATYLRVVSTHFTIDYLRKKGREKIFLGRHLVFLDCSHHRQSRHPILLTESPLTYWLKG